MTEKSESGVDQEKSTARAEARAPNPRDPDSHHCRGECYWTQHSLAGTERAPWKKEYLASLSRIPPEEQQ